MQMKTEIYNSLPSFAKIIREEVFIKEQGFESEYDEIDNVATHIVLFDNDLPVATCRVFESDTPGVYILGRLAVKKEYRSKGIGKFVIRQAEKYVLSVKQKQTLSITKIFPIFWFPPSIPTPAS